MKPGATTWAVASITRSAGPSRRGAMAAIRSPSPAASAVSRGDPLPSMSAPPRIRSDQVIAYSFLKGSDGAEQDHRDLVALCHGCVAGDDGEAVGSDHGTKNPGTLVPRESCAVTAGLGRQSHPEIAAAPPGIVDR